MFDSTPELPHKTAMCWALSPLYIFFFFGILVVFHPFLIIARLISFNLFSSTLDLMCWAILTNLKITVGTQFCYRGIRDLPSDRPLLIVSNHQSMYDIPMLILMFRGRFPRFISKRELARWIPSISFAVKNNKSALIDRNDRIQSLNAIKEVAKQTADENAALCLFPEGTRSRDGIGKKFKGAGFISILEEMPNALIIPVAVSRSWELLRYNLLPIPTRVKVSLLMMDPIEPAGKDKSELLALIEQQIHSAVVRIQSQDA